jgi:hypothetical protein
MPTFPKPEPQKRSRDRAARIRQAARKRCIEQVWARAGKRCETCGLVVCKAWETDNPWDVGHVHEVRFRSLGGDETDPNNTMLLCQKCHAEAHRLRVR